MRGGDEFLETRYVSDSLATGLYGLTTLVSINRVWAFYAGEALMYNEKFHLKIARDSMLLESVTEGR